MQVRDVGAAATGGLVVAGALTVPGMVRRVRDVVERVREDERSRTEAVANLIRDFERLTEKVDGQERSIDVLHEDLDILIGVVAGAVLDLDSPPSAPLARLVASRPGPVPVIQEIQRIFEQQREIAKAKREAERRQEEEEAGTRYRCTECDAVRPDYAKWMEGSRKDPAPSCPSCASTEEPKPRDA